MVGTGAGDEVPNPPNEVGPPKRGFCGARLEPFFSTGCDVEGVRLNGCDLLIFACMDEGGID